MTFTSKKNSGVPFQDEILTAVLWDEKCVIPVNFFSRQAKVNSDYPTEILKSLNACLF